MNESDVTMSRTQVQLLHSRDVNDDARPGRPSTSTTNKNSEANEAANKMISDNYGIPIPSNFYGCLRYKTCSSEDCFKIAKF